MKTTCGPMYLQLMQEFECHRLAFAAGHVTGQCEKVYLGVCQACMFCPKAADFYDLLAIVHRAAEVYDLQVIAPVSSRNEVWVCDRDYLGDVLRMENLSENSAAWHRRRARLCGVPRDRIDVEFHLRPGH